MSSSLKNRYQSYLFNFLNRRQLRLRDKLIAYGRRGIILTEWTIQILLYPLYLLLQTTRFTFRKIQQQLQKQLLLPSNSNSQIASKNNSSDTPINNILASLVINDQANNLLLSEVRGIATTIPEAKLVLVNQKNETLDLLNLSQQRKLQQLIIWEIANYYYQQRIKKKSLKQARNLLPILPSSNKTIPLFNYFWRLMAWEQTNKVAIAINLFGESQLACVLPESYNYRTNYIWQKIRGKSYLKQKLIQPQYQEELEEQLNVSNFLEAEPWFNNDINSVDLSEDTTSVRKGKMGRKLRNNISPIRNQKKQPSLINNLAKKPRPSLTKRQINMSDEFIDPNKQLINSDKKTIDTKFISLGYQKTWWRQLVRLIDNFIFIFEEFCLAVWRWVTRILKAK